MVGSAPLASLKEASVEATSSSQARSQQERTTNLIRASPDDHDHSLLLTIDLGVRSDTVRQIVSRIRRRIDFGPTALGGSRLDG
jgi:hypothetical protein